MSSGWLDVRLPAVRTAPSQVRVLVGARLDAWGLAALSDDVKVIASELVTNAVLHTSEREMRVRLMREGRGVLLEVWDSSDVMPSRREGEFGGRGLPLVGALASGCGAYRTLPHGKWVWARVGKGV